MKKVKKQMALSISPKQMQRISAWAPAIFVFCLALLVRIVYNATVAHGYFPKFDAAIYNNLATRLLTTHCYCDERHHLTTFRPPLWPFIIAGIYLIAGVHSTFVRLFLCFLGSGTCVIVYLLAKDLFGRRIALVTGIIAACYTGLFIWDGWLYTESLYTFLLSLFLFSLFKFQGKQQTRWIITAGLTLGLALLARPNGSVLIGIMGIWALLLALTKRFSWLVALRTTLLVIALAAIVNLPWILRNYTVTHSFSQVSTLGTTLVGAYNQSDLSPKADGSNIPPGLWWLPGPKKPPNPDFHPYTFANEQQDLHQALTWMRSHPRATLQLFEYHLENMWTPYFYSYGLPMEEHPDTPWAKLLLNIIPFSIVIFILAALGLIVTWTRKRIHLILVYLLLITTILQNILFYGSPRFRAPIEPFLVLLVGGTLWWLTSNQPGTLRTLLNARTLSGDTSDVSDTSDTLDVSDTSDTPTPAPEVKAPVAMSREGAKEKLPAELHQKED